MYCALMPLVDGVNRNISEQVVIEKIPQISIHVMSYDVSRYHLCDQNIYYYRFWSFFMHDT